MRPLLAVAAVALVAVGCSPSGSPQATFLNDLATTAPPKQLEPSKAARTRGESAFLGALAAQAKAAGTYQEDGEPIDEDSYIQDGYTLCGRGKDAEGPPKVETIIENMKQDGPMYAAAIPHLCPKYLPVWQQARGGFEDGKYTVGKGIKAGTYRTLHKPVTDCYWERSTGSGSIIANQLVTNAPRGVTVTIRAGEGFTSRRCGPWVRT